MTIPLLRLDDRTFDDLTEELQALIPRHTQDWTDRNASDPGIMLIELFAWVIESQIYRVNRIPKEVELSFHKWLIGDEWSSPLPDVAEQLDHARWQVYQILKRRHRLISNDDFTNVILDHFGMEQVDPPRSDRFSGASWGPCGDSVRSCVSKVYCVAERDLSARQAQRQRRGHVSVVVLAHPESRPLAEMDLLPAPVAAYTVSLNSMGKRVVVHSGNHVVMWVAASRGDAIESYWLPAGAEVTCSTVSPDDGAVAVACQSGDAQSVFLWRADDAGQFSALAPPDGGWPRPIKALCLASKDGPLAIHYEDGSVDLWLYVLNEGVRAWRTGKRFSPAREVYLRPGGGRLAVCTDRSIELWQLEQDWLAEKHDIEIRGRTTAMSPFPHRYGAVVNDAGDLTLWDIWRYRRVWTVPCEGEVRQLSFGPDGRYLKVNPDSPNGKRLDIQSGEERKDEGAPAGSVCAVSGDGQRYVTCHRETKRARVWRSARREELAVFEIPAQFGDDAEFENVRLSGDNRYLITTICAGGPDSYRRSLLIWEIGFDCVEAFVEERHQVGCRLHTVGALYVPFTLEATVVASVEARPDDLKEAILDHLTRFFDPRLGGPQQQGWPFARDVALSEVYQAIHAVPGVAYVPSLQLLDAGGHPRDRIEVRENELVDFQRKEAKVEIRTAPTA